MTTQLVTPDGRRYNPARDIAYLWPRIVEQAAGALEDDRLSGMGDWLKSHAVTMDELGDAVGRYLKFLQMSSDPSCAGVSYSDALEAAGWHGLRWEARAALGAYLGLVMTGSAFAAVRDVAPGEEEEARGVASVKSLADAGRRLAAWQAMPRWRRWLASRSRWWRRLLLGLAGVPIE